MNGVHDMGGQQGFGPVRPEPHEPIFHAPWEAPAMGLTVLMGGSGQWNIDQARSARESLPPAQYLGSSYYQIWLAALERMMLERGLVTEDELRSGRAQQAPVPLRVISAAQVDEALARGSPADRPARGDARFQLGQRVRARNTHPAGHTRLPRYVRGHAGTIVRIHGAHVLPDRHVAVPPGPQADEGEWLYTVVFDGTELWGGEADPTVQVSVDAWESYLEPWSPA